MQIFIYIFIPKALRTPIARCVIVVCMKLYYSFILFHSFYYVAQFLVLSFTAL